MRKFEYDRWIWMRGLVRKYAWSFYKKFYPTWPFSLQKTYMDRYGSKEIVDEMVSAALVSILALKEKTLDLIEKRANDAFIRFVNAAERDYKNIKAYEDHVYILRELRKRSDIAAIIAKVQGEILFDMLPEDERLILYEYFNNPNHPTKPNTIAEVARRFKSTRYEVKPKLDAALEKLRMVAEWFPLDTHPDVTCLI